MRRGTIERRHPTLSVSRSSFCYAPQCETEMNLTLMQVIDWQILETPFYGVQQMTWLLQNEGHQVNQRRIRRMMRLMRLMPTSAARRYLASYWAYACEADLSGGRGPTVVDIRSPGMGGRAASRSLPGGKTNPNRLVLRPELARRPSKTNPGRNNFGLYDFQKRNRRARSASVAP